MILQGLLAGSLLFGANYADYRSTQSALQIGAVERGPSSGLSLRMGVAAAETGGFLALNKHHKKTSWIYVGVLLGVNAAIVHHNQGVRQELLRR